MSENTCEICGVQHERDGLLCPPCFRSGQRLAPPEGLRSFVDPKDRTVNHLPSPFNLRGPGRPLKGRERS